ncbi:MAG: hypothetical protein D8M58_10895 [Calditrichaeota bacterium]|nr:MAG: hypothetical protein DWQ03_10270 [Calditrichota bacterium]MBL1205899.1 hypothetical protein [Calditrichota bacterium]NOG45727.1 hypothetical protein [Calditrichota bacterium]
MQNIKLFCGSNPDYYYFQNEIIKRVESGRDNWLAVLPVNRAVRIFSRKVIEYAPNQITAAAPVFAFDTILLDLYKQTPFSKTVVSKDLMGFLIEEILKKLSGQFSFLPKTTSPPNRLIQKVTKMISELRRFGYSANELDSKNAEDLEIEIDKLDDFVLILHELEKTLGDRYIDNPQAMHQAALNLDQEAFKNQFPNLENIFISGYGLFTPAMFSFIEKAAAWVSISIKLEYLKGNDALFGHTKPAFDRFQNMGAEIIELSENQPLAQKLFNRERKAGTFNAGDKIEHFVSDNRQEEIRQIAQSIFQIHKNDSVPLDKIAITFNPMETYVPSIRRIFDEYGIPFNLSTGYPLKQSPLISTLLSVLDVIDENFEYGRVSNIIQSPFLNKEGTNYNYLFKAIIKNRIRFLTSGWDERLIKSINRSGDRISEILEQQITHLKTFLEPFYKFAPGKQPVLQYKNEFLVLLEQSAALQWYEAENSHLNNQQKEREFRAYNRFMKILDQFTWSMQILFEDRAIEFKTWYQHLRSAVNNAVYNLTEWPIEAVQIMPRLEIQAIDYDILFVGGLVDGDFPRSSNADIFLNDLNREKMGLVASEDLLAQDRFIFYNLLVSANRKVILTTPRFSGEKALVPSTFLDDLRESCSFETITDHENIFISLPKLWESFGTAIQEQDLELSSSALKTIEENNLSGSINRLLEKIEIQQQRLMLSAKAGIYEGRLTGNNKIENYLQGRFKEHKWSITQLEDYAFCPMQYLLKRLFRLEESPEFDEEVSPLERGNTVHSILFKFYMELRKLNSLNNPQKHFDLLKQITRQEMSRLPFDGFFWEIEQMRYFGKEGKAGLLETFLNIEREEISRTGFIPAHFEFCFGANYDRDVDPASVENLLKLEDDDGATMLINGKIDRIDIDPKSGLAAVFDYKTGSIAGKNAKPISRGLSFQLPVYILAVEQLLDLGLEVVYGAYYQVKDVQNCKREGGIADVEKFPFIDKKSQAAVPNRYSELDGKKLTFDELIEFSRREALSKQKELFSAHFTHTKYPDDKMCKSFCDYRRICQKLVAKLKMKNK